MAAPVLTALDPANAMMGSTPVTVTITGTGFVDGDVVKVDGVAVTTVFGSATQLMADIDVAAAATKSITVENAALEASNALDFIVHEEVPALPGDATEEQQTSYLTGIGTMVEVQDLAGNKFLLPAAAAEGYVPEDAVAKLHMPPTVDELTGQPAAAEPAPTP